MQGYNELINWVNSLSLEVPWVHRSNIHTGSDELVFKIMLTSANVVVKGSDPTKLAYELTNLQLKYEVLHDMGLAKEARSAYFNGKQFMYEHVTHHKTITVKWPTDSIINKSINVPHCSIKAFSFSFATTTLAVQGTCKSSSTPTSPV